MTKHAKTLAMLDVAQEVLRETHPMTVRQVYYQLVSRQVTEVETRLDLDALDDVRQLERLDRARLESILGGEP